MGRGGIRSVDRRGRRRDWEGRRRSAAGLWCTGRDEGLEVSIERDEEPFSYLLKMCSKSLIPCWIYTAARVSWRII